MKVVVSIAGSDSSGGAGVQADLKVFEHFGVFGCSVITVLTSQNTTGVREIYEVTPEFVKSQLEAVFEDFEIEAVKIGMLYSNDIINVVKEFISKLDVPIIFDPVFISKAGSKLLNDDAIINLKSMLEFVTVTTPNQYEAKALFGNELDDKVLLTQPCAVVLKNSREKNISVDYLFENGKKHSFKSPLCNDKNTHGTGCSFSSAITANIALGYPLYKAVEISKSYIQYAIENAPNIGHGKGPILHNQKRVNDV